jgi:AGCS family alanine or glycine:cation symporter
MYDVFLTLITRISDLMWGPWTMIFIAFVSVYLTVRTGFFQVTNFGYIMRNTFGRMFDRKGETEAHRRQHRLPERSEWATWQGLPRPCRSADQAQFSGCGSWHSSA